MKTGQEYEKPTPVQIGVGSFLKAHEVYVSGEGT